MSQNTTEPPKRIQRKRTKGWRMPRNTVYVGRLTKWGNPCYDGMFVDYSSLDAVDDYRRWIERDPSVRSFEGAFGKPPTLEEIRNELGGKDLACWCSEGDACHADVLLALANPQASF